MYILIVGGGHLGRRLAKALISEGHEVLIVEKDKERCRAIANSIGPVFINGDGCETATLTNAGAGRAEMFIAVAGNDEDNLIACQVAKHRFNINRTIARVRNPKNESVFKRLGIGTVVCSTKIILQYIEEQVTSNPITHLMTFKDEEMEVVSLRIPEDSTHAGNILREIKLPEDCELILLIRDGSQPKVPGPNDEIHVGDQYLAVCPVETEEKLRFALIGNI